ncbi:MAG: ATP-binding protein, partial [Bacteroidetes bacterium]|nr:ATP-binding protein [Bacteroidota bacterium]
ANAIKFSYDRGSVEIDVTRNGDYVDISFVDNGSGIDVKLKDKIFELGASKGSSINTNIPKGTGLGLILCKELVLLNKGEIINKSIENKGAKFIIKLPYHSHQQEKDHEMIFADKTKSLVLSDEIKIYMKDWLVEFKQLEIYENSEIRRKIDKLTTDNVELIKWKEAMKEAAYLNDEEKFNKLIAIAQI